MSLFPRIFLYTKAKFALLWLILMENKKGFVSMLFDLSFVFNMFSTAPKYNMTRENFLQKMTGIQEWKKAQKQDVIQNGTMIGILYPFLHSTQYIYSQIIASLWNVGKGIVFQVLWIMSCFCAFFIPTSLSFLKFLFLVSMIVIVQIASIMQLL